MSFDHVRILSANYRRSSLFWPLQCIGWTAFGVMMFGWALSYWNARDALANKLPLVIFGFGLTLAFRLVYRVARRRALSLVATALLIGILSFLGSMVWTEAQFVLFQTYQAAIKSAPVSFSLTAVPFGTVVYYTFVLLTWSLLYYGINSGLDLEEQKERAARAESQAQSARLTAQRSQLEFGRRVAVLEGKIEQEKKEFSAARTSENIAVQSNGRVTFVRILEIDWVEAAGDYVKLHVGKKSWLLRETMSAIEARLKPHGFARIHRSTVVNLNEIIEMAALNNGEYLVTLKTGAKLKLSRNYRGALDQLLGK
jgi:hypothetical protein